MIVLNDVHTAHALRGVSLSVAPGEVVAVIGPSGAGKSTLLRALIGLEPVTSGNVTCFGASDAGARQLVGFCFQDFQLFPHLTVVQNVALALRVRGIDDVNRKAEGWLARVACSDLKDRRPAELSGGQKQRVALARALALEPRGMLLDEPVSALDPECVVDVVDECRKLKDSNKAVIVTTHHLAFARAIATRVVFLVAGRIVEEGAPEDVFGSPKTARLREYLAHCLA